VLSPQAITALPIKSAIYKKSQEFFNTLSDRLVRERRAFCFETPKSMILYDTDTEAYRDSRIYYQIFRFQPQSEVTTTIRIITAAAYTGRTAAKFAITATDQSLAQVCDMRILSGVAIG
jgi:hypothetical protein